MTQHPGGLHSHNVRIFMFQLLRALSYIHGRRILHRDLKPHNLLISYLGELKLADFVYHRIFSFFTFRKSTGVCCAFNPEGLHGAGLARSKSIPAQNFSSEVVTLWYRPPDVLMGSIHYSTALDMWGAGCIFIEMLQGAPAFAGGSDELEQLQNIWTALVLLRPCVGGLLQVLGVPSEDSWPGVSLLPYYRPERFIHCRPKLFRDVWKR
ncbi:PREDICTED: cyclin-dependent kinase 15-like [Poecilia mexicana]|uniref:cyclin-dependent kinase 15-like n=1 Tax=Poecilia mexicana TaxID=48701 RepID=UPI00072ED915|nr:PREDICTED: cyclin-dependent kinase 15-like [Poecilia mexicana]